MSIPLQHQHFLEAKADDAGIDRLTHSCLALHADAADAIVEREIALAITASRWDDAVKWQRVRLRVKRLRNAIGPA